ncbi:MAG: outer membrane protein assembly factor BamD [Prevotella sp.]|nr:outer membrane protein assembly factor BamD [Prevotella sp.]
MKKTLCMFITALLLSSCANQFNRVLKSTDMPMKYEYAKEYFATGKYQRSITLLNDLISFQKGTDNAQESLYMLAMAQYCNQDYESASAAFKKYATTYPKGYYAENANFHVGQSLFMSTPEPRLDQSQTVKAIAAFQDYLDLYPDAKMKSQAQDRLFELQDKLVKKELYNAQLYYDLGGYFGNVNSYNESNYESCIITAQNALKDYPYTSMREQFALLIMKSKYELARNSVASRQLERFQDAEDECYGFVNEYPDSKNVKLAEKFISVCKKYTSTNKE